MPQRLPAVLFDLDGTLVDTIALLLGAMRHAFTTCALPLPRDEEWVAGIGTPLVTQFRGFVAAEPQVAALVAAYRAYQREHHDRLTNCYGGILDLVRRLDAAGHPLAVVTSKSDELAHRALHWTGLAAHIHVVIGADSVARHKPDPEPVRVALARLAIAPADAVFVGDSPHDVASGNAAGVRTIGVTWGAFDAVALKAASVVVASVEELGRRLDSWAGMGT